MKSMKNASLLYNSINKKLCFLILFFSLNICYNYALTPYQKGFNEGYAKGYSLDNPGVVAPVPPVVGAGIYEDNNSYTDGYSRGVKRGSQDAEEKKKENAKILERKRYETTAKPNFIDGMYNPSQAQSLIPSLVEKAQERLSLEDYDGAINIANSLINAFPNLAIAYFIKSNAYYQMGDYLYAFNYASKSDILRGSRTDWFNTVWERVNGTMVKLMLYNEWTKLKDFCDGIKYPNGITDYYSAIAYMELGEINTAKRYIRKALKSDEYSNNPKFREWVDRIKRNAQ